MAGPVKRDGAANVDAMGPLDAGIETQEPINGLDRKVERIQGARSDSSHRFQVREEQAGAGQLAMGVEALEQHYPGM